jgi:hypothetical protein
VLFRVLLLYTLKHSSQIVKLFLVTLLSLIQLSELGSAFDLLDSARLSAVACLGGMNVLCLMSRCNCYLSSFIYNWRNEDRSIFVSNTRFFWI